MSVVAAAKCGDISGLRRMRIGTAASGGSWPENRLRSPRIHRHVPAALMYGPE
jgi:hypothetical protein